MAIEITRSPKISIVIPSYNKADYIEYTLQSIVDQKYPNLEVIIQDGGSTDGTLEKIKAFRCKCPEIIKLVSKKDNGQVDAINKGCRKATGEIIAYINADDVLKDGTLLLIAESFSNDPDCLWITGFGDIIDDSGKVVSSLVTKYKNLLLQWNNYQILLIVNYITQPATFITRKAYEELGPFTGTTKYVMEYALWLKIGKVKMPKVIKRNLASFRLTTDNISSTSFKELLAFDYQIAKMHTDNPLILWFHLLNNWGRIGLISILNKI